MYMPDNSFQVVLVDKAGRRMLILVGLGGMCCCAIALTVGLKLQVCSPFMSNQQLQVNVNQSHISRTAIKLLSSQQPAFSCFYVTLLFSELKLNKDKQQTGQTGPEH